MAAILAPLRVLLVYRAGSFSEWKAISSAAVDIRHKSRMLTVRHASLDSNEQMLDLQADTVNDKMSKKYSRV